MALLHVGFFSNVLGMCMNMDVILPQRTFGETDLEGEMQMGDDIPTLYLLHGMSDDHTIWQRRTSIERYANDYGIAVVMPTTHLGWYTDMVHGLKYFTFIAKELPEICHDFFPQLSRKREDTFVAGLSMGGFGALKCGLACPETFGKVAALSSGIVFEPTEADRNRRRLPIFYNAFGDYDSQMGTENDLYYMAKLRMEGDGPKPEIFQWCGTEDPLYNSNVRFRDHLQKIGYPLIYSEGPGGHSWDMWDEQIQNVLKWMFADRYKKYNLW